MSGFQQQVGVQPAPGVPGAFASGNPRFIVPAGAGGYTAGPAGVTVGNFAWSSYNSVDGNAGPATVNSFGSGPVLGFIAREEQALITAYLADAGLTIPAGFPVTPYNGGDFWAKNSGASQALPGMKAYAAYATGAVTFAATGSPTTQTSTTFSIAAGTSSVTGYITGNVLTVTTVGSGTVFPGTILSGNSTATGTTVISQLSGTTGGVGTYAVSIGEQATSSGAISGTYGLLTLGGTINGAFPLGAVLSGTGVTAGTAIYANGSNGAGLTGSGLAGTYVVQYTQTASTGTLTGATNVETKWVAVSAGLTGEVVKITDHLLG